MPPDPEDNPLPPGPIDTLALVRSIRAGNLQAREELASYWLDVAHNRLRKHRGPHTQPQVLDEIANEAVFRAILKVSVGKEPRNPDAVFFHTLRGKLSQTRRRGIFRGMVDRMLDYFSPADVRFQEPPPPRTAPNPRKLPALPAAGDPLLNPDPVDNEPVEARMIVERVLEQMTFEEKEILNLALVEKIPISTIQEMLGLSWWQCTRRRDAAMARFKEICEATYPEGERS